MPTVILLDLSLSMFRPVVTSDATETVTRLTLASTAINTILDYLNAHIKLEYVSLVTFSSQHELSVPFTRDYDIIRSKLPTLEEGDKTCIEAALVGVNQLVLGEWGSQTQMEIILITDGSCGVGPIGRAKIIQALPLPPSYPVRIHIMALAAPNDQGLQHAMPLYQEIVDLAASGSESQGPLQRGVIYCPEHLTVAGCASIAGRLCEQQYAPCCATVRCGQLEARVQLYPPTADHYPTINIIGFISASDLGTPITISKHLVIPHSPASHTNGHRDSFDKTQTKEGQPDSSEEEVTDPSKVPNFCVLLHGALKVEGMCAIAQLGPSQWGGVWSWCEAARARRSCLLLGLLGEGAAPWAGDLAQLGPEDRGTETFPLRAVRSYGGSGSGCWSRPHALLADVQKVLRHARKLPDKTQHLYKELNRVRRSAVCVGFTSLLGAIAGALDREWGSLPAEGAAQLQHLATALRDPRAARDASYVLTPLPATR